MTDSLRDRVKRVMDRNLVSDEERDAIWAKEAQNPDFLFEVLKEPILGIPPSKRTLEERRDLLFAKIRKDYGA